MNWSQNRVLVTGGAGFIGSHLVERAVLEGARVRVFVHYNSRGDLGSLKYLPSNLQTEIEVVRGDLRDADAVRGAARDIDTLFHLGANIAIPYSYIHPRDTIETNIMGTLNVLLAARDAAVTRIVHTSTSEVYGTARYIPIDEKHPLQAQSPYAGSKVGADKIAESFHNSFGLPVITVRPFNTYGPRQTARAIIPTIISQVLNLDTIKLGSLVPSRDFTYVSDTVEGFLAAAAADESILGEVINIGTGYMISIGDLANLVSKLLGKSPEIDPDPQRLRPSTSEVMQLQADAQKAAELLGWTPKVSLDDGLMQTIKWISENTSLYDPGKYGV